MLSYTCSDEDTSSLSKNILLRFNSYNYISELNTYYDIKPIEYRTSLKKYKKLKEDISNECKSTMENIKGNYSLAFMDLNQSQSISINNEKTVAASVIKIYIMIEAYYQVYNNELALNKQITLTNSMKTDGSGVIQSAPEGTKYTIEELINFMMIKSDNTAANILIDILGMNNINDRIKALGCVDTELNRKMMDEEAINKGIENYISVDDLCLTFTKLYNGQCINKQYDDYMINIMKKNETKSKIPSKLPNGVEVASKSGEYLGVQNDAGIVFTDKGAYILCITTKDGKEQEQVSSISDISKYIYDNYINYKN